MVFSPFLTAVAALAVFVVGIPVAGLGVAVAEASTTPALARCC
jgi:hypothetical protein